MSPDELARKPVKVVTEASEVACVYYGGAHFFDVYFVNPVSINYIGNKYKDPYSNTYNSGWRNHPKNLWRKNQNQPKPQVHQAPQVVAFTSRL